MKNPLTGEQQRKLLEISKLDPDKQKEELPKFLKTLNKEQIEFMKGQQNKCLFCSIANKEVKSYVVYEDREVMGVLDINPANKGHVLLFPLIHTETLFNLKETDHIFMVAKKINDTLIKKLGAKGTNIFIANGVVAGQLVQHFIVHIIPRFENDGINFSWEAKKVSEKEMEETAKVISAELKGADEIKEVKLDVSKGVYEKIERIP